MANDILRGRQVVIPLTNKSGGGVIAGDVVRLDSANAAAFTTTTTSGYYLAGVGVALETIASNAVGRVCVQGYVPIINLNASATLFYYLKTHTVAKQATPIAAMGVGVFGQVLGTGTTPAAWLFGGLPQQGFVGARYKTAAGQSIANSTIVIVDFATSDYDTGTLVTTGAAWKFTAPSTGYYHVQAQACFVPTTNWALGESADLDLYKNGVRVCNLGRIDDFPSSSVIYKTLTGGTDISLAATDYIDIRLFQQSGAALTLIADAANNYVSVSKIN